MPKVRLATGEIVDVSADALFQDDGTTPFATPSLSQQAVTGRVFTEDDVARIRQEEKDKVYGRLDAATQELTQLREQVGSLTAAEQRRAAELEQEKQRLEEEARRQEESELDARSLVERREQEWSQRLEQMNQTWEQKWNEAEQQRQQAEAIAQREREFGQLRDYTLAQVQAHENDIAPQLRGWITGNTQEEIDASVQRAIEATNEIARDVAESFGVQPGQQFATGGVIAPPASPATPGTRATGGPGNTDPATQFQQLTPEQIAQMPMDQYAKLRGRLNIGGQASDRGLFG